MTDGGSPDGVRSGDDDALRFLARGGDMGARMRAHDWAATPLGPAESWLGGLDTIKRSRPGTRPASPAPPTWRSKACSGRRV